MKKSKKNLLKTCLFVCLGCIATVAFAAYLDLPGAPGKPDTYDVDRSGCTIKYLAPKSDGGSPIIGYFIEYRETESSRWIKLIDRNPGLTYRVANMVEGRTVEFRVSAESMEGRGPTSKPSDPITFENPYRP